MVSLSENSFRKMLYIFTEFILRNALGYLKITLRQNAKDRKIQNIIKQFISDKLY